MLRPVELLVGLVAVVVAASVLAREHAVVHLNFVTLVALAHPLHHGEKTVLLYGVYVAPLLPFKPSTLVVGRYLKKDSTKLLRIQHVLRKECVDIRGVGNAVCRTTAAATSMPWTRCRCGCSTRHALVALRTQCVLLPLQARELGSRTLNFFLDFAEFFDLDWAKLKTRELTQIPNKGT